MIDIILRHNQQMIENRNWNYSRMNPLVQVNQSNTQLNVYDRAASKNMSGFSAEMQPIIDLLDAALEDDADNVALREETQRDFIAEKSVVEDITTLPIETKGQLFEPLDGEEKPRRQFFEEI